MSISLRSYRHAYHAGNWADVLKHAVLALVARYLVLKDKPLLYLETHAGAGSYPLDSRLATETAEWRAGIGRLWDRQELPQPLLPLMEVVRALNPNGALKRYPGSPLVAGHFLRRQDHLDLFELHPEDAALLQRVTTLGKRVRVYAADGYAALGSLLPPAQRRGLVLIDPPYELGSDYRAVGEALAVGYRRFPTGVYAIWYPLFAPGRHRRLLRSIAERVPERVLVAELTLGARPAGLGMYGAGVVVVNPPWTLEAELGALLPWLARVFGGTEGSASAHWLAAHPG